jgi:1,4-dihydroxy-2-naphthoate octaprenyltransferase
MFSVVMLLLAASYLLSFVSLPLGSFFVFVAIGVALFIGTYSIMSSKNHLQLDDFYAVLLANVVYGLIVTLILLIAYTSVILHAMGAHY